MLKTVASWLLYEVNGFSNLDTEELLPSTLAE